MVLGQDVHLGLTRWQRQYDVAGRAARLHGHTVRREARPLVSIIEVGAVWGRQLFKRLSALRLSGARDRAVVTVQEATEDVEPELIHLSVFGVYHSSGNRDLEGLVIQVNLFGLLRRHAQLGVRVRGAGRHADDAERAGKRTIATADKERVGERCGLGVPGSHLVDDLEATDGVPPTPSGAADALELPARNAQLAPDIWVGAYAGLRGRHGADLLYAGLDGHGRADGRDVLR